MKTLLHLLVVLFCGALWASELQLGSPFGSHMVLQRQKLVRLWGEAKPGETVSVDFAGQRVSTKVDAQGRWALNLAPLEACGEGRSLVVRASGVQEPLVLEDVLVGEVWLASGQSNMVFTVSKESYRWAGVLHEEQEIAAAKHSQLRMFTAAEQKAYQPQDKVAGSWKVCSPETVGSFSAIAYFFARDLQRELGVPVGILTCAYGASTVQAWIRREAMQADPDFREALARFDELVTKHVPPTQREIEDWEKAVELAKAEKRRPPRKPGENPVQDQHNPTVLFNGMIKPVLGYTLRGFLWYQGESITGKRTLFPAWNRLLISDWRSRWGGELPFLFCQLAPYGKMGNGPEVRAWQEEALTLLGTGMAVTLDVGDEKDVHPHDKAPVGNRLARLALELAYGRDARAKGPKLLQVVFEDATLRLKFTDTYGGLEVSGGELSSFEVAGPDGVYYPATATVRDEQVELSCAKVLKPSRVRYAWSNFPGGGALLNQAGIPAAPFSSVVPEKSKP